MSFKNGAKRAFWQSGICPLLRSFQSDQIYIFNYHRIRDIDLQTPFDEEVYGPTELEFIEQMTWLKNNFNIWSEQNFLDFKSQSELIAEYSSSGDGALEFRSLLNGPVAAVTFDDGYEDNYRLAYPILKKLGIPAIFFIPTETIETRQLSWWDQISFIVKKSPRAVFTFRGKTYLTGDMAEQSICEILRKYRSCSTAEAEYFIPELLEITRSRLPSYDEQCGQMMTWEHIVEVSKCGFGIGAHTHTHSILSQLSHAEQFEELQKSKSILESRLNKPIYSLAYPCGQYEHFNLETKVITKNLGYELAFSFLTGPQRLSKMDFYDIRRTLPKLKVEMLDISTTFPNHYFKNVSLFDSPRNS
jgi:peptidoglycan/xylan/chitin deacetylase (PgdA/CDA1 family)